MKFLKSWLKQYKLVFFEIRNYIDYITIIKRESQQTYFKRLMLRRDWICRVYTVINFTLEEAAMPAIDFSANLLEKISDANNFFKNFKLEELVYMDYKPIQKANQEKILIIDEEGNEKLQELPPTSYLIIYGFIFRYLTWWFILKHAVLLSTLVYFRIPLYNTLIKLIELINYCIHFITL